MKLELVENQTLNNENHMVTAELSHFSTYILADIARWLATKIANPEPISYSCERETGEPEVAPLDLVFVIDSSGSMGPMPSNPSDPDPNAWNKDPNNNRISGVKHVIDSLTEKDRAAIVDFDSSAILLKGLSNATPEGKAALKAAAEKIDSVGGTNSASGLGKAVSHLQTYGNLDAKHIIIFLTDGYNNYSSYDNQTLSYARQAEQLGIKIFTIGLGDSFNTELLTNVANISKGDFYQTLNAEELVDIFTKAKDVALATDTDKDCLPDWVEKLSKEENGYIVEDTLGNIPLIGNREGLNTGYKSDYQEAHSDKDELTDLEELAPRSNQNSIEAAKNNIWTNADKTRVTLKEWPRSNPDMTDTDGDKADDKEDDKPTIEYKAPVILIHGIRSNSGDTWGADAWLDNGQSWCVKMCQQDKPDFLRYVPADRTVSGESYSSGAPTSYTSLDAQYIKSINYDKNFLAPYLVENGYEANKNMFVFNWEHADRILLAAENFEIYLNSLVDHLEDVDPADIDIVNEYEDGNEIQFNLVTHSAGGLVSRYYIENLMDDGVQIDRLITVDTPHWGSNDKHNTGAFGVLIDIDRDDSPLLYSDPDIRESSEVLAGSWGRSLAVE